MMILIVATAVIVVPAILIVSIYFSERLLGWAADGKAWSTQRLGRPLRD